VLTITASKNLTTEERQREILKDKTDETADRDKGPKE
jgi:hypothetical protein